MDGKTNRLDRPTAQDFEFALLEASNKVIKCPSCGAWYYPRKKGGVYEGCPWCDAPSKPSARLNFYDVLTDGVNYRTGRIINGGKQGKLVNTYILSEGKNYIKGLYVLRYDDTLESIKAEDNYITIAKTREGYWVYNEFSKDGIVVKRCRTGRFLEIENNSKLILENGDYIYFEFNVIIEIGGKKYSFVRMARFVEEEK